jgi:P-type Mg2+ transporter
MESTQIEIVTRLMPSLVGLSSQDAAKQLAKYGLNDPTPMRRGAFAVELLFLFLNPLVIILLVASVVSAILGQGVDAGIIVLLVLLGITINFVQTYRSQRAMERLRQHTSLTATVLRDGEWQELKRQLIVPGDIVRLSAGDLVPADAQLLESRDLYVQQAALTGESMPAEKEARNTSAEHTPDAHNLVFLGTSVVSGTGIARVLATGRQTSFGGIAEGLVARPEETEFERGLRHFGLLIMRAVFFLVLFIVVVRVALHKDAFESFVFAVALAVGLTPEFLPMITSVTLARGAVRMARKQVIVKHLPAIQNLGSIDVLCSDKTGTLTVGVMTLSAGLDAMGQQSDRPLTLAYLNSTFETGIRSPLDAAILSQGRGGADDYCKCDEIPFDFNRRRLSIIVEHKDTSHREGLLITKGAPEGILEICESYETNGQMLVFDGPAQDQAKKVYRELFNQGLRVLAVAYRKVQPGATFSPADEHTLTLAGFLAFADPPSPDARASVAALKRDGVQVKILTGDNELVARNDEPIIVLGEELETMSEPALGHIAEQASVFARVSPMQKLRILRALKHRGHVVGYLGDGINDAPFAARCRCGNFRIECHGCGPRGSGNNSA